MADSEKLTPEQIQSWRTAMVGLLGPYALIMSDEDVQRLRDKMQEHLDSDTEALSLQGEQPKERE